MVDTIFKSPFYNLTRRTIKIINATPNSNNSTPCVPTNSPNKLSK